MNNLRFNLIIDHTKPINKSYSFKNNVISKIGDINYHMNVYIENVKEIEFYELFNNGFLPDFWEIGFKNIISVSALKWRPIRSTRLNLKKGSFKDFKNSHYNRRVNKIKNSNISFYNSRDTNLDINNIESQINNVWLSYCDYKNFIDEKEFENFKLNKDIFTYFFAINNDKRLEAFSIDYQYNNIFYIIEQSWNYLHPELSLLRYMFLHKVNYCFENKIDYLYLGEGYFENCIYKSEYPYFEWWSGSEWSSDITTYTELCKNDILLNS